MNIKNKFVNPATLEDFCALSLDQRFAIYVNFVAAQPSNKEYFYYDPLKCPLAQFATSLDFYKNNVNMKEYGPPAGTAGAKAIKYFYVNGEVEINIIPTKIANHSLRFICESPHNFGALHERLLAANRAKLQSLIYWLKRQWKLRATYGYV